MKVTYQDVKNTFPPEKHKVESIYGRIVPVRKLSYLVAIPFIKLKVSAFTVSIISVIIALIANIFLAMPNSICRIMGVIMVPIWHLFDCVDGNVARYNKTTSDFGVVADAISGYYMFAFYPLALGIASYNIQDNYFNLPPYIFLILGGVASISDILMRLIHQKYVWALQKFENITGEIIDKGDGSTQSTGFQFVRHMIDVECTIVGIPMFVLFFAPVFNLFHVLTIYYCIFFVGSLLVMTAYYMRKSMQYAARCN